MEKLHCTFEKISDLSVGIILLAIGLGFTAIGFTVLPILGLVIAAPVLIAAFLFLAAPKSKACQILSEKAQSYLTK